MIQAGGASYDIREYRLFCADMCLFSMDNIHMEGPAEKWRDAWREMDRLYYESIRRTV